MSQIQSSLNQVSSRFFTRIRTYWRFTKSIQTLLLVASGIAGFMTTGNSIIAPKTLAGLAGSLFLTITGSTILNIWYDRDIDSTRFHSCWRPYPVGQVNSIEGFFLGLVILSLGISWALFIDLHYGLIVFGGFFFDVIIYTFWLKRRTSWAVLLGGISGCIPFLAGRTLGGGSLDGVGLLFSLAILFWTPAHILTFSPCCSAERTRKPFPAFPDRFNRTLAIRLIAASCIFVALAILRGAAVLGLPGKLLLLLAVFAVGLILLAGFALLHPSGKINFCLSKYASALMLGTLLMLIVNGF